MREITLLSRYFLQVTVVIIALAELGFFLAYFGMYHDKRSMISDILVADDTYNAVISTLLSFRLIVCILFFIRYYIQNKLEDISYIQVGLIGVLLAAIGWTWLVTHTDSENHNLGVGIFCVGSFVYSFILLRIAKLGDPGYAHIYTSVEILLFVASGVLVITYITSWALNDPSDYISEHMAYVAHLLFFILFFLYHTPDPSIGFEDKLEGQQACPEQAKSLLQRQPMVY